MVGISRTVRAPHRQHQENQSRLSPARPTPPSKVFLTPPHKSAPTQPQSCSLAAIFAPRCQSIAAQLCSHLLAMLSSSLSLLWCTRASSPRPNHASTPASVLPQLPSCFLVINHVLLGFVNVKPRLFISVGMDELQHCNEAKIDGSVATLDKCSKKLHQNTKEGT